MSVYTKKGDKGETGLFRGERIAKNSLLIEAIGTLDEANSWLGVVGSLSEIQEDLMTISAILAGARLKFSPAKTKKLERQIDKLEKTLPPLKNFILPGGSRTGAKLHFARTLVRRAERAVVALQNSKFSVQASILTYLNRLSDYLFIKAREENFAKEIKEKNWTQKIQN